jgi:hypothetical protein
MVKIFPFLTIHLLCKYNFPVKINKKTIEKESMIVDGEEYVTVKYMAEQLNKTPNAIKQLLHNLGINPDRKVGLYKPEVFEIIKNAPPPGRPKKAAAPEPVTKSKKAKK